MGRSYRFIGKSTPRKDAFEIVTGKAVFIDDMKLPGLLYAKVLRSPYAHATVTAVHTEKADNLPGVRAVLTYKNVPEWKAGIPPHVRVLDRKVRFVGDAVALVAADSGALAEEALSRIEVEYEQLGAVYDVEEALKDDAPQLYDEFPGNVIPPGFPGFGARCLTEIVMGDVQKGFLEADVTCEGKYSYEGFSNPLPLEPPGVIAEWDGADKLTIWSATQSASWHRFVMLPIMGFPDIRSVATHCGGSFGSKNYAALPCLYAASLARATGRPVKVFYSKEEQLGVFTSRPGSRFRGKVGMNKDGAVTAISGDWLVNTGAFSDMTQAQVAVGCGEAQLMLRCPNWDVKTKLVCTNRNAAGVVRGFGGQEFESALLPLLMEAMAKLDVDPVEFFKKNYVKPGDGYFWREGKWWTYRGIDYSKAMDQGAAVFGWKEKWKGWLKPSAVSGSKRRGIGVGVHGNADVGEDVSEAYVRLNPDGTVTLHVNVSESGTGQRSSLCKMAAEVLQVPLEKINMTPPDSSVNPFEFGLVGSRGTYAVGSAVIAAAEDAKKKLLDRASKILKAPSQELESENGKVYVRERPDARISWSRIIGIARTCTGLGRFEPDFSQANFIMTFVEVEVDLDLGKVDLLSLVPATDVGQIIDPRVLWGQFYGCLGSAGADTAVFEESVLDARNGYMLNPNMIDYKWRTFSELPSFKNVVLESPMATHRFEAVGVGEITTSPVPFAILMAVSNALGARMSDYPLTPEKILMMIRKGG